MTHKGETYTSVLLRTSYREGGKVKHETLGNLSYLPRDVIDYIRKRLAGGLPEGAPPAMETTSHAIISAAMALPESVAPQREAAKATVKKCLTLILLAMDGYPAFLRA